MKSTRVSENTWNELTTATREAYHRILFTEIVRILEHPCSHNGCFEICIIMYVIYYKYMYKEISREFVVTITGSRNV